MALTAGSTGSFATNTDANDARSNAAATTESNYSATESNDAATESNDARSNMAATGTNKQLQFSSDVLLNANEKLQRKKEVGDVNAKQYGNA